MVGILAEKPSALRNFAKALGGTSGTYNGEKYVIVAAAGHLYEFLQPNDMVSPDKADKYKNWDLENLPWNEKDFSWEKCVRGEARLAAAKSEATKKAAKSDIAFAKQTLNNIKDTLKSCDEICIATDVDPTGEGQLLAWEIIDGLGLHNKTISRMYHEDEAPKSVQKAFTKRKVLPDMEDDPEYKKSLMRSQWDLLSMQWTRIATKCVDGVSMLRQGRLKSAMVRIVGDGLKAVAEYKKVPYYQNRFRDENGNMFTWEDEPKYPNKADVPNKYTDSPVIVDSKEMKSTPPPRLIDLAKLAAVLAPKGIKSKDVLDVYQKMYEDQVVSYPRTEDKYITEEQFNEMLPLVDQIADVVGVNKALLTHRTPRKTHIKSGCAHGANRPGINVPKSLNDLKSYGSCAPDIYEVLAKSFLTMFGEDYEYEAQTGHLEKYPDFKGRAAVPKKLGWKQFYQPDDKPEDDDENNEKELGKIAKPFVYEGFPKRPPTPTTKWLMAQLEKHDVGTGATRTSIYADVTNEKTQFPLLIENKGKLSMSPYGEQSYILIQDTHIGDLKITEDLMANMRGVAEGSVSADNVLHDVQQLVSDDMKVMLKNKANLPADATQKPGTKVIGKCPRCGKDIVEGRKGFGCVGWKDDPPCRFTIWKENGLLAPSKKQVTEKMAQALLTEGTYPMKDLVSKKGNKFDGVFKLKEDGSLDFEFTPRELNVVGVCPRCGRDIVEGSKGYGCLGYRDEENKCTFTIWKTNGILEKSKKELTPAHVRDLLTDGKCKVKGLVSKSGSKYDGIFVLEDTGDHVNLNLSFDAQDEEEGEEVGTCPRCGRPVTENARGFGCVGYKDEDNPCKFFLSKSPPILANSHKSLSASQAEKLLNGEQITIKNLTSKAGKKYDANFIMKDDGQYANLEMNFDDLPKKTSSRSSSRSGSRSSSRRR